MRLFIGVVGATALLLWSLACWATVWLLSGNADFVATQVQQWSAWEPEIEPAVATLSASLARFGSGLVWALWAIGALLLVVGSWLSAQVAGWLGRLVQRGSGWIGSVRPPARSPRAADAANREPAQVTTAV